MDGWVITPNLYFFSWSQFIQICKEIFFVRGLGGWWVGTSLVPPTILFFEVTRLNKEKNQKKIHSLKGVKTSFQSIKKKLKKLPSLQQ